MLPIVAGAAFGAFVVALVLNSDGVSDRSGGLTPPTQNAASSAVEDAARQRPPGAEFNDLTPDQLPGIASALQRREAALALAARQGNDFAAIERIAESLPQDEAVNFRIHAIINRSTSDMPGAFAAAVALPEIEQRRLTLLRLAPVLAATNPLGAIAAIEGVDPPRLEREFTAALIEAWAMLDPARLFNYLESEDASRFMATELAFETLAANDPDRLLAIADELRRDIATLATTAALEAMIEKDVVAAVSLLEALPSGADRSRLEVAAAEAFGEQDPKAAWAWVTGAQTDALTRIGVVRGIQRVNPDMAWDLMLSQLHSTDGQVRAGTQQYLLNYVNSIIKSESTKDIVIGLDRLLSLEDPRVDASMQTNIQAWANRDPEGALDWSLRNLDRVNSATLLTSLSAGLARTNIDLARQTTYRLDESQQAAWAAGVGKSLAQQDLALAMTWAYEFPSGPLRDAGLQEVIRSEAYGGSIDRQLLNQFNSDRARSEAASSAARRFACDGHIELALEIATTYITDEQLLDQTRRGIEENTDTNGFAGQFTCQFQL